MSGGGKKVKASRGEKMLAQIANEQYAQFKDRFVPVENAFMDRIRDTEGQRKRALGQTNTEVTQRFMGSRIKATNAPRAKGASTGSGLAGAARGDATLKESAARSGLRSAASFDVRERERQGLTAMVAGASGQKRDALKAMSGAAFDQTSSAVAKNAAATSIRGTRIGVAQDLIGTAAAAYGAYSGSGAGAGQGSGATSNWTGNASQPQWSQQYYAGQPMFDQNPWSRANNPYDINQLGLYNAVPTHDDGYMYDTAGRRY